MSDTLEIVQEKKKKRKYVPHNYYYDPLDPHPVRKDMLVRENGIIYYYDVVLKRFLDTYQVFMYSYPVFVRSGLSPDHDSGYVPPEENALLQEAKRKKRLLYSQRRSKSAIYDLAKNNRFDWFCTWSFDGYMIDRFDYAECSHFLGDWLDRMRRKYPELRYVIVPELHTGKDSKTDHFGNYAFHFHGLVGGVPDDEFYFYKIDPKTKRDLYSFESFIYGVNSASKIEDPLKSANYIGKYVTKELTLDIRRQKRYWRSNNLQLPELRRYLALNRDCFCGYEYDVEKIGQVMEENNKCLYQKIFSRGDRKCLIMECSYDTDPMDVVGFMQPRDPDPHWVNMNYVDVSDEMTDFVYGVIVE